MLERPDKLVFYFTIDCQLCANEIKVSHVVMEEQAGSLICSLCGKTVKVPSLELIVKAAKDLNGFLGDTANCKHIKLVLNEAFVVPDDTPAAAH